MKITRSQLKRLIKEEMQRVSETAGLVDDAGEDVQLHRHDWSDEAQYAGSGMLQAPDDAQIEADKDWAQQRVRDIDRKWGWLCTSLADDSDGPPIEVCAMLKDNEIRMLARTDTHSLVQNHQGQWEIVNQDTSSIEAKFQQEQDSNSRLVWKRAQ
jgi:hypothetical protein